MTKTRSEYRYDYRQVRQELNTRRNTGECKKHEDTEKTKPRNPTNIAHIAQLNFTFTVFGWGGGGGESVKICL